MIRGGALLVATCGAFFTGCAVPGAFPSTDPVEGTDQAPCAATMGQQVLEWINGIRLDHGLRPLAVEERLVAAAVRHSGDQAARGEISHIGSDGSAPGDRATAAGYEWALIAENVAGGMPSARAVVEGWMNSPPHRATILSADAVHGGVGYVERFTGSLNHVWTLVAAAPRDPADSRILACHP